DAGVSIAVTFPNVIASGLDVSVFDEFVKLNNPGAPVRFVDLWGRIAPASARWETAEAADGRRCKLLLTADKAAPGAWPQLAYAGSKVDLLQRRGDSQLRAEQAAAQEQQQKKAGLKAAAQRAQQAQWDHGTAQRQAQHDIESDQRVMTQQDLAAWSKTASKPQ